MEEKITGLCQQEVRRKKEEGKGHNAPDSITKTKKQIFKENILTLFNFLNFAIAGLLLAVGAYSNMLFILIIILNILIGIIQELKAKKLVDGLSILNRPQVTVVRDGEERQVKLEELVEDDVMVLESGMQICNDAEVIMGELEVNESLLTGESDGVAKARGDELLSGSSVISGKGFARVTHVGKENYATRLAEEVKREKAVESELLASMRKVTRLTGFLIIPLGILLLMEALVVRNGAVDTAVVSSAAALLGMLPKGLVLLISVSLANGVIRLSKQKILVQNIYSLETLAHVDTLCLDKTGTLTDGKLNVSNVIYLGENTDRASAEILVAAYMASSYDNNATMEALKKAFPPEGKLAAANVIPFSSKRKWGAVAFRGMGTVFTGAPERILGGNEKRAEEYLEKGYRVVAVGYSSEIWYDENSLPVRITPLFMVVLEDTIRRNAAETLDYFYREGVDVKIISGDHVKTVSAVARKAGLRRWKDAVDLAELGETVDYDAIAVRYAVFARVTPKQKEELVKAMKRQGRCVAMTGDGVNDLLALREADCSIAVAEGSDASRQISQIVLLNSDFTYLPQVVLEGRKVINNVTRTAGVFFIKTIYSVLLSIFCLILNIPFPFIPIQITLVDAAMEAWPSFLTIAESDTGRIEGSFLKKSLMNALPFAAAVTGMVIFARLLPFSRSQTGTVMYLLLILVTMAAVVKSCVPFTKLRVFICASMIAGTFGGLYILPSLFEISTVTFSMALSTGLIFAAGLIFILILFRLTKALRNKNNLTGCYHRIV